MARRIIRDSDGDEVTAGCYVRFSYGIPPTSVLGDVIERNGRLIVLTPGHRPEECPVSTLKKHVGVFWIEKPD